MAVRPKLVNIDCNFDYALEQKRAEALGADYILRKAQTEAEIMAECLDADIILVEEVTITAKVIAQLRQCRAIIMYGVGVDNIDVDAATQHGVVVCNTADFCTEEVSDHAVALLLACARRLVSMDRNIRAGGWSNLPQNPPIRQVRQLTLGLIGLGRIGRGVAAKMSGFRMRILAADPYQGMRKGQLDADLVPLDVLLRESDLISIHIPLTPETRGLVGEAAFRKMKPSAMVVNTSRGAVIDQHALVRALQEKWIAGAGLDVMEEEPLPASSSLREFDNVILTPHKGAVSVEARARLHATVADSIEAILSGFWPPFPVNPQVQPRFPLRSGAAKRG